MGIKALFQLVQAGKFALGYLLLQVGAQWLFTVSACGQGENADDPLASRPGIQLLIDGGPNLLVGGIGPHIPHPR